MPFASDYEDNPVRGIKGLTTEYAAGGVVLGALVLLILIRRGWGTGVRVPGVGSVSVGR